MCLAAIVVGLCMAAPFLNIIMQKIINIFIKIYAIIKKIVILHPK